MKKNLIVTIALGLSLVAAPALAASVEGALIARNPVLAQLRHTNPKAYKAAAKLLITQEKKHGLKPGGPLPATTPPGRDAGKGPGHEYTTDNPDILWLYNSSPEGMSDLISILKSAGQKPKT